MIKAVERSISSPASLSLARNRVLVYRRTTNIGDAIQTFALARLLQGPCAGVYRDLPAADLYSELPFVVNGWLGHHPPVDDSNCIFAGVHLGNAESEHIQWIRQSAKPVGVRDSYTKGLLSGHRIASHWIGCATLTLPRYHGPRHGRYTVDVEPQPGAVSLTNLIPDLSWTEQWDLALDRLDLLRKAEVVYSNRIHAILPCLAFGTPVVFPSSALRDIFDKSRLTILHDLGFVYDETVEMDVSAIADRFLEFLGNALQVSISPMERPEMPIPVMSRIPDDAAPTGVVTRLAEPTPTHAFTRIRRQTSGSEPKCVISFCNRHRTRGDGAFFAVVDLSTSAVDVIRMPSAISARFEGSAGLAPVPGGYFAVLQGSGLARLDQDLTVKEVLLLDDVRDGHSLCPFDSDSILVASTGTNCLVRVWQGKSEVFWRGDQSVAKDRIHLNSVACNGSKVYATMFGASSTDSWLDAQAGSVVEVTSGETVRTGIYHPHSLSYVDDTWWVCESLGAKVLSSNGKEFPVQAGYLRGLSFAGDIAVVASSRFRHRSRSTGIEVSSPMRDVNLGRNTAGLSVFRKGNGDDWTLMKFIDLAAYTDEIYDVALGEY